MRKQILIAAAVLSLAGVAGGGAVAMAQNAAPPPAAGPEAPPPPPGGPHEHGGWHHHGPMDRRMGERPFMPGTFSLFYHQGDKQLSQADVQQIAQAILLWNGQHGWKVADVQTAPDHSVNFSYTAPDGTVIAKFSMDQQTGRITRTG
jgi:hypothetical protein